MTTAEIINRLFKVYPWAKLEQVNDHEVLVKIGAREYYIQCDYRTCEQDALLVHETVSHYTENAYDQSHALHLRDVLLGKKRDDAGNVA